MPVKQEPALGQLLWSGRVGLKKWRIYCIEVVHPTKEEEDENGLISSTDPFWRLRFESDDGELLETTFSPTERIIFGTIRGWSKPAIGEVKNALAQYRWQL